jgi:hypothetical protein
MRRDLATTVEQLLEDGEWSVADAAIQEFADSEGDGEETLRAAVGAERDGVLKNLRIHLLNLRARAAEVGGPSVPDQIPVEHARSRESAQRFVADLESRLREAEHERRAAIEARIADPELDDQVRILAREAVELDHLAAAEWFLGRAREGGPVVSNAWPMRASRGAISDPREVPRHRRWGWSEPLHEAVDWVAGTTSLRPPDFPTNWIAARDDMTGQAVVAAIRDAADAETDREKVGALERAVALMVGDEHDDLLAPLRGLGLDGDHALHGSDALGLLDAEGAILTWVSGFELLALISDPFRRANLLRTLGSRMSLADALDLRAAWPGLHEGPLARYVAWLLDFAGVRTEAGFVETLVSVVDARPLLARALLAEVLAGAARERLLTVEDVVTAWSTPRFSELARDAVEERLPAAERSALLAAVFWELPSVTVEEIREVVTDSDACATPLSDGELREALEGLDARRALRLEGDAVYLTPRLRGLIARAYPDIAGALRDPASG